MIHPTAIIHKSAKIARDVEIGPYTIIGEHVNIGTGTTIASHSVIEFADVGENCKIFSSAFIGTAPQDVKYKGEKTKIIIGDGTVIRECVTLNRGTSATGITKIGKKCLFMAYSHVAHDCVIGNEVLLANSVALAGHVEIDNFAVIGGMVGIHQFVKIGKLAMLGAGAMVPLDIPPFTQAQGDRARLVGLNVVGLKRRNFDPKVIEEIKSAYRTVFTSGLSLSEAIDQLDASSPSEEVKEFVNFIKNSKRGVTRPGKIAESDLE